LAIGTEGLTKRLGGVDVVDRLGYVIVFGSAAWAGFTRRDVLA
jgi:hypothetical protein